MKSNRRKYDVNKRSRASLQVAKQESYMSRSFNTQTLKVVQQASQLSSISKRSIERMVERRSLSPQEKAAKIAKR